MGGRLRIHLPQGTMALGRDHDRATALATVPVALVIALTLGPWPGVGAGLGCLIGGYWLSPDLDTHCRALKRWGPLRLIWAPYRWLIPHRSLWSHGPLLGTTTRLLLLGGWLALATAALPTVSPIDLWSTLEAWGRSNPTLQDRRSARDRSQLLAASDPRWRSAAGRMASTTASAVRGWARSPRHA